MGLSVWPSEEYKYALASILTDDYVIFPVSTSFGIPTCHPQNITLQQTLLWDACLFDGMPPIAGDPVCYSFLEHVASWKKWSTIASGLKVEPLREIYGATQASILANTTSKWLNGKVEDLISEMRPKSANSVRLLKANGSEPRTNPIDTFWNHYHLWSNDHRHCKAIKSELVDIRGNPLDMSGLPWINRFYPQDNLSMQRIFIPLDTILAMTRSGPHCITFDAGIPPKHIPKPDNFQDFKIVLSRQVTQDDWCSTFMCNEALREIIEILSAVKGWNSQERHPWKGNYAPRSIQIGTALHAHFHGQLLEPGLVDLASLRRTCPQLYTSTLTFDACLIWSLGYCPWQYCTWPGSNPTHPSLSSSSSYNGQSLMEVCNFFSF